MTTLVKQWPVYACTYCSRTLGRSAVGPRMCGGCRDGIKDSDEEESEEEEDQEVWLVLILQHSNDFKRHQSYAAEKQLFGSDVKAERWACDWIVGQLQQYIEESGTSIEDSDGSFYRDGNDDSIKVEPKIEYNLPLLRKLLDEMCTLDSDEPEYEITITMLTVD